MKKFPTQFWMVVLLLGWLFDFLFWKKAPGISFAIYALLTLLAGFALLWRDGIRPAGKSLILVPFILVFAAMTFLRREPMTIFLSHILTLILMSGLAVTYRGGRWMEYSLADYFSRGFDLLASLIVRAGAFSAEVRQMKQGAAGSEEKPPSVAWPIVRGILFAIPVVAFFAALLSSADLVFAQRLDEVIALFRLENLPEYIFRAIYIAVLAYALAGVYLHAAARSTDEKLLGLEKPFVPRFLGFIEAAIVLGSVILLFGAFVAVQFGYFFGGQANIRLEGFTYAEYARRGFGELVAVAFFALLLFLGLSAVVKRETSLQQRVFSGLGIALVALVAVMLVSAFQRLVLYETAYGFTRLRTYTHVFMVWLALLLAAVVVLDVLQRQRVFAFAVLLASVGFALSLAQLDVDSFIVRQNIQRFERGEALDVGYLASLSADAVPVMEGLYQSPGVEQATRERLGAALACYQFRADSRSPEPSWQAFHISDYQASAALARMDGQLAGYQVDDYSDWPVTVTTPQGLEFDCYSSTFD
jgi:hypothetical protein